MKTFKIALLSLFYIFLNTHAFSQKTEEQKREELKFLRDQKLLNIVFDYEGMTVNSKPEAEFIKEKVEDKNEQLRDKGNIWKKDWEDDKKVRFPKMFVKQLNKYLSPTPLSFAQDTVAQYTLIVKTLNIFTSERVTNITAHVDFEFRFVESSNPEVVLCKLKIKEAKGLASAPSYDKGERYEESYSLAGKLVAKYLIEHFYKK